MIQNPSATQFIINFYNKMIKEGKAWYEYEDVNFVLIAEKPSQIKAV